MTPIRYEQGDGAQSFWHVHSSARHAIAMFQHCKWKLAEEDHADEAEVYLMVWRQAPAKMVRQGMLSHTNATLYYRRAEDVSMELLLDFESMADVGVNH
eukprot:3771508-Amphidinium_carterae.1